jgi:glycosyltransferase involved in cell wall biosynthesis
MRVLYDGLIYETQVAGGINRYFSNIIGRLPENFVPLLVGGQQRTVNYPVHSKLRISDLNPFSFRPSRIAHRWNIYYRDHLEFFSRPNLAHPTYYSLLTGRPVSEYRCPVVITVWDMIYERFSKSMDPTGQIADKKRRAIQAAHAIICISENTKNDLNEYYRVPANKIKVTHLASEIDEKMAGGSELIPERPYYLYVGSRASYKNFDGLLKAFSNAVSARPEIALCTVGSPFTEAEKSLIAELKLTANVVNYDWPTDCHLAKLYHHSVAFVYPSLYEGFGITLVEAMSCATPVIASNSSSIPEVVDDAALLVDPGAVDDLTDALLLLLEKPAERARLVERGRNRSKLFSWDKTAAQTLEVYHWLSG